MSDSIDQVLDERGANYGTFKGFAELCQRFKLIARSSPSWHKLSDFQKEALEMCFHKMSRILNGNPNHLDSWTDLVGYAALAEKIMKGENP